MATVASMPSYFPMHWFSIHQLHQVTSWAQKFFFLPKTSNQWFDGSTDAKEMMSCKWWALWCRFLLLGRETLLAGKLHCGVLHHSTVHCYHCHHRSAVQCDSNVKWSGMCYNWASCDHMYDCRAFIIEYQELCRAVLSWLQGISWVHWGGRLSWGAGGIWAVTCFDLNSHHQTFSQVITTSCTDPPPVGTQELVRGWAPGTAEHFSVTVTCFTPTGLSH